MTKKVIEKSTEDKNKEAAEKFADNTKKMITESKILEKKVEEAKVTSTGKLRSSDAVPDVEDPIINRNKLLLHYMKAKEKRINDPNAKKKLAVVGYAETSRDLAPFNRKIKGPDGKDTFEFEIWGLNELYQLIPRADRWFEIHAPGGKLHNSRRNANHRKWLQNCEIPIYMPKKLPDIKASVAYPLDEILELFGDYFTNSISYMLCLGIYEGFPEIHMYGVDMALNKEYREQKPSCEWFMGMAAILCDKFVLPFESDMLKAHYLYGFQNSQPLERKFRDKIEELKKKKNHAMQSLEEIKFGVAKLDGAIEVTGYYLNNHINPEG